MFAATETAAYGAPETTREELQKWLTAPTVDVECDVRLAFAGDRLIGYVDIDRVDGEPPRWWSDVRVHPDEDARDRIPELLAWAEERAREGGILRVWVPSAFVAVKSAVRDLGFARIRSSYRMEIDLGDAAPPKVPTGIGIRPLATGDEPLAHEIHQEAFADSWEHVPEPYGEWRHWLVDTESYDPSLWFVAWDGDRPAGAALNRERNSMGWVGILAVRRDWRRRGIGRALLEHSFAAFRARGLERAGLGVDAESLTGANRLYEAAGMRVARELEFWDKHLPARR